MPVRISSILAFCCIAPVASPCQTDPATAVLLAQDSRNAEALGPFLRHEQEGVRERAALAACSVQDTSLLPSLITLLDDPFPGVRATAAAALGQLGAVIDSMQRFALGRALLVRLTNESDERVVLRLVEAVGLAGDASHLGALIAGSEGSAGPVAGEVALTIGRYAYRGIRDRAATAYAVRLLDRGSGPDRWKAAYALMRIGDAAFLAEHASRIAAAAQGDDPDVRMFVAAALGPLLSARVALLTLQKMAAEDPDWRVRVNAVKALGQAKIESATDALITVLQSAEDTSLHVAITGINALGTLQRGDPNADGLIHPLLLDHLGRQAPLPVRRKAASALALRDGAAALPPLAEARRDGLLPDADYAAALGEIPDDRARMELAGLAASSDLPTARIALEGLRSTCLKGGAGPATLAEARKVFVSALASPDPSIVAVAGEALGDSLLKDESALPELLMALNRLSDPPDGEAMVALIRSLGAMGGRMAVPSLVVLTRSPSGTVAKEAAAAVEKITGEPYVIGNREPAPYVPPDVRSLAEVREEPLYQVRTSRGLLTISLLPDAAPLTCLNFRSLVARRFYDGTRIHRVVPNFVVQGGDPQGDGWGGPGYAIRSEFSLERYDRAAVGMASSGKDTEGSQFFVTHSRQPHLDGRYTIFGRVVSGMDVVDQLQVGDRIVSIRAMTAKGEPGK